LEGEPLHLNDERVNPHHLQCFGSPIQKLVILADIDEYVILYYIRKLIGIHIAQKNEKSLESKFSSKIRINQ
jgi:hypothetical protein